MTLFSFWRVVAVAALLVLGRSASAQTTVYELDSDFGPVTLRVAPSGTVDGSYPKYDGQILGQLIDNNTKIQGVWVQPKSDTPCSSPSNGSIYWGKLYFGSPASGQIVGKWGYCESEPSKAWNARIK